MTGHAMKARRSKFPAKYVKVLGKKTDRQVAALAGVSSTTVFKMRTVRGVPPSNTPTSSVPRNAARAKITPAHLKMLGKRIDSEIAALAGVSTKTIGDIRRRKGIAALGKDRIVLPQAAIRKLGKCPDSEIAATLNVSPSFVSGYRRQLGIEAFKPTLPADVIASLGKEPDIYISQRSGVSPDRLRKARHELGIALFNDRTRCPLPKTNPKDAEATTPDLARALDISHESAMLAKHRLQLETTGTIERATLPAAAIKLLGKKTDRELASKFDVSARTIYRARVARGIKKFSAKD